jgi:phosphatidylserine synthase
VGPDAAKHARNAAIVVGLALAVTFLPGGRAGGATVSNLLTVLFLGGLAFLACRFYMERRLSLLDMEDRRRAVLYASLAVIAFAIVATSRLWSTGPGALIWLVLVGIAVYGIVTVVRAEREY